MDYSLSFLTIQQALTFLTVAEENGFASAAEKLHMTQSAVSKSIAKLEKELDIHLFNRTTRQIALTESGQFLYEEWKKELSALQSSYRRAQKMEQGKKQILRLGLLNTARPERYFQPLIGQFTALYPDIRIEIESQYMNDLENALVSGQFDLIFLADFKCFSVEKLGMRWCYAAKGPAYLLMSGDHPLADRTSLTTPDLNGLRFITVGASESDDFYLYDLSFRLRPYGIIPDIAYRYKTAYDIRYLFRPDEAVLMIDGYFDYAEDTGHYVKIPVTDQENGIICAWNPNSLNPCLKLFLESLPYYHPENQ